MEKELDFTVRLSSPFHRWLRNDAFDSGGLSNSEILDPEILSPTIESDPHFYHWRIRLRWTLTKS